MSDYTPPIQDLPIFDSAVFLTGDEPLTYNTAVKKFLKYPYAQGKEYLQEIVVSGNSSFLSPATMSRTTIGGTSLTISNTLYSSSSLTLINSGINQYASPLIYEPLFGNSLMSTSFNFGEVTIQKSVTFQFINQELNRIKMTLGSPNFRIDRFFQETGITINIMNLALTVGSPLEFNSLTQFNDDITTSSGVQIYQIPAITGYTSTNNVLNGTEIRTALGATASGSLLVTDTVTSNSLFISPNVLIGTQNPLVGVGDQVISADGTGNEVLTLTTKSTNCAGVRISSNSLTFGAGGTASQLPTNRFAISGGSNTVDIVAVNTANFTSSQGIRSTTSEGQTATAKLLITDGTKSLFQSPNISVGAQNPITTAGDQVISASGTINTEVLDLTVQSATNSGIKILSNGLTIGAGGGSATPTNRISISGVSNTIDFTTTNTANFTSGQGIRSTTTEGQTATAKLLITDGTKSLFQSPNISTGSQNPITTAGDQVICASGTINTEALDLTVQSATNSGIKILSNGLTIGAGGGSATPAQRMVVSGASQTIAFTTNNPLTTTTAMPALTNATNIIPSTAWVNGTLLTGYGMDATVTPKPFTAGVYNNGMVINSDGNVFAIVNKNVIAPTTGFALFQDANGSTVLNSEALNNIGFKNANIEYMTLRGTAGGVGNIGIRNSAPLYELDVTGTIRATTSVITPLVENPSGNVEIKVNTTGVGGSLRLQGGTGLLSATSGGNSGQHLVITINGVNYKIALQNP